MQFQLDHFATIQHLNVRKEGKDDERETAIDIKLVVEKQPVENVLCVLGAQAMADVQALWIDDEAACVRLHGISSIDCWPSFQAGYQLDMLRNRVFVTKIKKFNLRPLDGRKVDLTFSVTVNAPPQVTNYCPGGKRPGDHQGGHYSATRTRFHHTRGRRP
jgi:hypothetical protein